MGRHAELKAAVEAAEQVLGSVSVDAIDAALKAHMDASNAWLAYVDRVDALRRKFSILEEGNKAVDTCVCAENASGVYQDGHDDHDLEYWCVMIAVAEEQVQDAKPVSCDFGM